MDPINMLAGAFQSLLTFTPQGLENWLVTTFLLIGVPGFLVSICFSGFSKAIAKTFSIEKVFKAWAFVAFFPAWVPIHFVAKAIQARSRQRNGNRQVGDGNQNP